MMSRLKLVVLWMCRALGLFRVTRTLTAGSVRIICYHGISVRDEEQFQPMLFMSTAKFRQRMQHLRRAGYRVVSLTDALQSLSHGTVQPDTVVITFDDGWAGIMRGALPVLREHGFPATFYVTTHNVVQRYPVLDVCVAYLLWKGRGGQIDLARVWDRLQGVVTLRGPQEVAAAVTQILSRRHELHGVEERRALLERLAICVGENPATLRTLRVCELVTPAELSELATGFSVQLHTHRHRLPVDDREAVAREIEDNREILSAATREDLVHLCYPSGEYSPAQWPWLSALGITSAVTTDPGLCGSRTPRLGLPRFLDSESFPAVIFDAELSGFLPLLRRLTGRA